MSDLCCKVNFQLAFSCALLWYYVIASFLLLVEATNFVFLFILISVPICTYYGIHRVSIPQPPIALITEVIGREPKSEIGTEDLNDVEKEESGGILIPVIAHRFAGFDAPENTLQALDLCYKNGATAVEFDLALTKDLVPIVFHDDALDRVSFSSGDIQGKTWDELCKIDVSVKHPFHERYLGSLIPTLDAVIKKTTENDMRLFIDIKDNRSELINIVAEAFEKNPILYKRAVVSSFNFWVVYAIRKKDPGIVTSMAWRPYYMSHDSYSGQLGVAVPRSSSPIMYYWSRILDVVTTWFFNHLAYYIAGLSAVLIHKDVITMEMVRFWKSRNVRVIAWTVNSPVEKLFLRKHLGVAYMTDTMMGN